MHACRIARGCLLHCVPIDRPLTLSDARGWDLKGPPSSARRTADRSPCRHHCCQLTTVESLVGSIAGPRGGGGDAAAGGGGEDDGGGGQDGGGGGDQLTTRQRRRSLSSW